MNDLRFARKSALLVVFELILFVGLTASVQVGRGALILLTEFAGTAETSVLQNGGFEQGLTGWREVHGQGGAYGFSSSIVHSGSHSLVLGLRPSRPGGIPSATVEGVSQSVSVLQLRGLKIEGWYHTGINTNAAAVRLVVQVGELVVRYFLFYGPEITSSTTRDNQTLKSILRPPTLCPSWCSIAVDASSDFKDLFDPARYDQVFLGDSSAQITVSLELLIYRTNDAQYVFWDDVNATAQVLSLQSTTTTSTSTLASGSEISSTVASSSTSTRTPATIVTTFQETVGATQLSQNAKRLLPLGVVGLVIVALVIDLTRRIRQAGMRSASSHGVRSQILCHECGRSTPIGASFCDGCGTRFRKLSS